jgi:hypothetical protein
MYEIVRCHLCDDGIFFAEDNGGTLTPKDHLGDHRNRCPNKQTRPCSASLSQAQGQCWYCEQFLSKR